MGSLENKRKIDTDAISLLVVLILVSAITVTLIQNYSGVGFVSRGTIGAGAQQGAVPISIMDTAIRPTIERPAVLIRFKSNLPYYDVPVNQQESDVLPADAPLTILADGMPDWMFPRNAQVSIDGEIVPSPFEWDPVKKTITFIDLSSTDRSLSEGTHEYSFTITTSDTSEFQFSRFVTIDRTSPGIKNMFLSADRKILTFSVSDFDSEGNPGAGLDNWNASGVADALNVALIRTTSGASTPNPYTLETGLPNGLECKMVLPNSDARLDCVYPFKFPLPANKNPVVFALDDAGNETIKPLDGDYALYEESILSNMIDASMARLSDTASSDLFISLQAAPPSEIILDFYIVHSNRENPTAEHITAEWTINRKYDNTFRAAQTASQWWMNRISSKYPGLNPTIRIGKKVVIVPRADMVSPEVIADLTEPPRIIPSGEYPWFFNSNCDIDMGNYELENYCIQKIRPCNWIGCASDERYFGFNVASDSEPNILITPKDSVTIPIIIVDYVRNSDNGDAVVGGLADVRHGAIYLSYLRHMNRPTKLFSHSTYEMTLTHELGHMLGLGHSDNTANIMVDGRGSTGMDIESEQIARVQAGLVRSNFKPPMLGMWWSRAPSPSNADSEFTDCGPVVGNNTIMPRLLDNYSNKIEEAEAPYSGIPSSSNDVLRGNLKKKYCPLVFDGLGEIIQPAPVPVDSSNASSILAQYPNAVIRKAIPPKCNCERDETVPNNGWGTEREPGYGGPIGGGVDPETKEPKPPKPTNCGKEVPGYSQVGFGSTFQVWCPNETCPSEPASTPGGVAVSKKCSVTEGSNDCGSRASVDLGGKKYCCSCRPATPPPNPPADDLLQIEIENDGLGSI